MFIKVCIFLVPFLMVYFIVLQLAIDLTKESGSGTKDSADFLHYQLTASLTNMISCKAIFCRKSFKILASWCQIIMMPSRMKIRSLGFYVVLILLINLDLLLKNVSWNPHHLWQVREISNSFAPQITRWKAEALLAIQEVLYRLFRIICM